MSLLMQLCSRCIVLHSHRPSVLPNITIYRTYAKYSALKSNIMLQGHLCFCSDTLRELDIDVSSTHVMDVVCLRCRYIMAQSAHHIGVHRAGACHRTLSLRLSCTSARHGRAAGCWSAFVRTNNDVEGWHNRLNWKTVLGLSGSSVQSDVPSF